MSCFQSFSCVLIVVLSGCSTPLANDSGWIGKSDTTELTGSESGEDTQTPDDSDASGEDDTSPLEPPAEDDSNEGEADDDDSDESESEGVGDDEEAPADTTDVDSVSVSMDSLPTALPPYGTEGELVVETAVSTSGVIADLNVTVSLTHTCTKDLTAVLVSPEGTAIELFDLTVRPVCSSDLSNTVFDDDATVALASGASPFEGPHRPSEGLDRFNGEVASGTWTLSIVDDTIGDRGSLTKWSLDFTVED